MRKLSLAHTTATANLGHQLGNLEAVKDSQNDKRTKIRVRWWHLVLLAIVVICFFGLAWWQWTRFQSGSGTFQNLGYALQWPLFAGFAVFAYRMILRYENEKLAEENDSETNNQPYVADKHKLEKAVTAVDEDFLPTRRNDNVAEFNRLADPAARRRQAHQQHPTKKKDS